MTPDSGGFTGRARVLAGLAVVIYLALEVSGLVLTGLSPEERLTGDERNSVPLDAAFAAVLLVYLLVGALIVSRGGALARHPVGWLLMANGLCSAVADLGTGWSHYAVLADPGALPAPQWAAWLGELAGVAGAALLTLLFLLFPTGRLPSPRWRVPAALVGLWTLLYLLDEALEPGPLSVLTRLENPVGVASLGFLREVDLVPLAGVFLLVAVGSVVVRFRSAAGEERQQLKPFLFASALTTLFVGFGLLSEALVPDPSGVNSRFELVLGYVAALLFGAVGVSIGVAVLRYRLYAIDLVIRKTLVYGGLTLALAATYLGLVLVLQLALAPLTEGSGLAVAASTLAVAALFRPARDRIQALVDRRFYRRRYDAQRTVERFGARLRDEVGLEALGRELRLVVGETVQPAHVSLWLRANEVR